MLSLKIFCLSVCYKLISSAYRVLRSVCLFTIVDMIEHCGFFSLNGNCRPFCLFGLKICKNIVFIVLGFFNMQWSISFSAILALFSCLRERDPANRKHYLQDTSSEFLELQEVHNQKSDLH